MRGETLGSPDEWNLTHLWNELKQIFPVSISPDEVIEEAGGIMRLSQDQLVSELVADAEVAYENREEELTPEIMRQLERRVLLSVLDRKWREHLYEMDYLKDGIGLRSMAQRDPLVEYRNDGHQMFLAMAEAIKEETVGYLFNIEVKRQEPQEETAVSALTTPVAGVTTESSAAMAAKAPAKKKSAPGRQGTSRKAPAPQVDALGLEVEQAPQNLSYSSSQGGEAPARQNRSQAPAAKGGNRAERRAAERAARRRR